MIFERPALIRRSFAFLVRGGLRPDSTKDFTPSVLFLGRIFHGARELRDSNLIFRGPLAGPLGRYRLSLVVFPRLNRTGERPAMTTLQRTAIVAGVGSEQGLGAAVARRFALEGQRVIVSGRTEAKIAQVVRAITRSEASIIRRRNG